MSAEWAFRAVRKALTDHGGVRFLPHAVAHAWDSQTWAGIRAVGGLAQMPRASLAKFARAYRAAGGGSSAPRPNPIPVSGRDRAIKETEE